MNEYTKNDSGEFLQTIRKANLEKLVQEARNAEALSMMMEYSGSSLMSKLRKSLATGGKKIGENTARKLEGVMKKPIFWMDRIHDMESSLIELVLEKVDKYIENNSITLSDKKRRKIYSLICKLSAETGIEPDIYLPDIIELSKPE